VDEVGGLGVLAQLGILSARNRGRSGLTIRYKMELMSRKIIPGDSRRNFIGSVATGLAGAIAVPAAVLTSNNRLRVAVIGAGDRGMQLARELGTCSNIELTAVADIYEKRREEVAMLGATVRAFGDYRKILDDKSVDAVLIATPQHLHATPFLDALSAGKHIYVEKAMAFTVEESERMRAAAVLAPSLVVQVGHQFCTSGMAADAARIISEGKLGKITAIHAQMYRNTPHGKAQWVRPVYPSMTQDSIAWNEFLGCAPERPFDADRFVNWRLFNDYSGGNVHENLSQQLSFWYKVLDLSIPEEVTMSGGIYLWKDGREVPDTMTVSMKHSEEILFSWDSGFGNSHPGSSEEVLGTDGTLVRGQQLRYSPQKVNRPSDAESFGQTPTPRNAHLENFFASIRENHQPGCPVELGYRVSIACRMAVESYLQGRTVRWDAATRQIV